MPTPTAIAATKIAMVARTIASSMRLRPVRIRSIAAAKAATYAATRNYCTRVSAGSTLIG